MRVLIVEDEPLLAGAIAEWLREDAHAVDVVQDGAMALERLGAHEYDVVVLDRDVGSVECCLLVKSQQATKILMLGGPALGADDYLPKHFGFPELSARVQALGTPPSRAAPPKSERAGLRADPDRRGIYRDDRYISLSDKEFSVLLELMRAGGGVVSAERLLEKAQDGQATDAVRMTIAKLRRKLGDPPIIETALGAGYRIP